MTGQVVSGSPLRFGIQSYSIDSFSEFSSVALSRTPTRAIVPPSTSVSFNTRLDEELFRDLFGSDVDPELRESGDATASPNASKKSKSTTPIKPIVWNSGATLSQPFGPSVMQTPPPPSRPNQSSVAAPSLHAPVPRQDAHDLMTARPPPTKDDRDDANDLSLSRVPEVDEEVDDDELQQPKQMGQTPRGYSQRRVVVPSSPGLSLKKKSPSALQHETLRFLEKLDLKTLLAQPRPDVTNFLPIGGPNNQFAHGFQEEFDERPGIAELVPIKSCRKPSSRKEPLSPLNGNTTRLAHMAQMYGTTATGPRKARKETLERLSNPISGHTSTLQALSPDLRKKREAEMGSWPPPDTSTPAKKTLSSRKTKTLIDRLSEAQNVYEAAAGAPRSRGKPTTKTLIKPSIAVRAVGAQPRASMNQEEHEHVLKIGKSRARAGKLGQRKVQLKETIANHTVSEPERPPPAGGGTFLTQHEEDEAQLASRTVPRKTVRPGISQRLAEKNTLRNHFQVPQRPTLPSSVRARKPSATAVPPPIVAKPMPSKRTGGRPLAEAAVPNGSSRQSHHPTALAKPIDVAGARFVRKAVATRRATPSGPLTAGGQVLESGTEMPKTPLGSGSKSRIRRRKSSHGDESGALPTPTQSKSKLPQMRNTLSMDSGLVTSERGHRRATVAMPIAPLAGLNVTCRQCRVQILLDDMESHECNSNILKAATHSPRASTTALLDAATRASSFLDSFLDTSEPCSSQKPSESSPEPNEAKEQQSAVRVVESPYPSSDGVSTSPQHVLQPVSIDDTPPPSHRYESLPQLHSPMSRSGHSESNGPDVSASPQHHLARLGRSLSVASTPTPSMASKTSSPLAQSSRPRGVSESSSLSIECRVRGVRLNKDKVAVYSIVSSILNQLNGSHQSVLSSAVTTPREVIIERRYREFYAFALTVYAIFPSKELWARLPPKTSCLPTARNQSGGFLLRRKNGLDDFVRRALELLDLGSTAQGSIGQWYLVRKFLNLPPNLVGANQPTKDRSLVAAMQELSVHARQSLGWSTVRRIDEHDATYEKVSDGFHMMKRVKSCPFPARAIFDRITKRAGIPSGTATIPELRDGDETSDSLAVDKNAFLDPLAESVQTLRRENHQTWTERVVLKGGWGRRSLEMVNLKSWKVDENGSIIVVMIPGDDSDWASRVSDTQSSTRVDSILGGWIITPIPGEETCSVTWLMQANFGECNPRNEFTGSQGFSTAFVARSFLSSWADEISHLLMSLEGTYDPVHYRSVGPLLSGGDFNKLKLDRRDSTSGSILEDPRVYILAHDLVPSMCLLIHKSSNTNALVFRTNHLRTVDKTRQMDLDATTPLKAEWIMFEKRGNPRQDLSVIERSTTYPFSTRSIAPNVFHVTLELVRRDCVLRYDPMVGYALFTTINGKQNIQLKRVYLSYSKPSSRLSFAKLEEIHLFGKDELEIIST